MTSNAETLVTEYFRGLWAGDLNVCEKYLSDDYIMIGGDGRTRAHGPAEVAQFPQEYAGAFPDLEVTIEEVIGSDRRVVIRWTARGTHKGEFRGIGPSFRPVTVRGVHIFTLREQKIVEERYVYDSLDLYEQLGTVPGAATDANLAEERIETLRSTGRTLRSLAAEPIQGGRDVHQAQKVAEYSRWLQRASEEIEAFAEQWERNLTGSPKASSRMQETDKPFDLQYLQLQQKIQQDNRQFTLISNIMKAKHDTAKNAINNLR